MTTFQSSIALAFAATIGGYSATTIELEQNTYKQLLRAGVGNARQLANWMIMNNYYASKYTTKFAEHKLNWTSARMILAENGIATNPATLKSLPRYALKAKNVANVIQQDKYGMGFKLQVIRQFIFQGSAFIEERERLGVFFMRTLVNILTKPSKLSARHHEIHQNEALIALRELTRWMEYHEFENPSMGQKYNSQIRVLLKAISKQTNIRIVTDLRQFLLQEALCCIAMCNKNWFSSSAEGKMIRTSSSSSMSLSSDSTGASSPESQYHSDSSEEEQSCSSSTVVVVAVAPTTNILSDTIRTVLDFDSEDTDEPQELVNTVACNSSDTVAVQLKSIEQEAAEVVARMVRKSGAMPSANNSTLTRNQRRARKRTRRRQRRNKLE